MADAIKSEQGVAPFECAADQLAEMPGGRSLALRYWNAMESRRGWVSSDRRSNPTVARNEALWDSPDFGCFAA